MKTLVVLLTSLLTIGCTHPDVAKTSLESTPEFQISESSSSAVRYVDFSDVAAATIDAVVHIKNEMTKVTPLYESFFGFIIERGTQQQVFTAFGSGVIISTDGYIITNNHVVQDAERLTVTLNDRRELPAVLIGNDPATDLAIIKIEAEGLTAIPFGNSDNSKVGEPVLAIGNPFNLTSTVTAGIISAKARNVGIIENAGLESPIESFIQTDAAVNSGNSGGALVNSQGQLIGVIAAIASGDGYYTGYSFAIPSNLAVKVASDLKKYGYVQRAYLGVNVGEVQQGVLIEKVLPNCAAQKAGLQQGDILQSVNGTTIRTYSEMMQEVGKYNPGDIVSIQYLRNGRLYSAEVTLLNSQGTTAVLTREQMNEALRQQQQRQKQQKKERYYIPF